MQSEKNLSGRSKPLSDFSGVHFDGRTLNLSIHQLANSKQQIQKQITIAGQLLLIT